MVFKEVREDVIGFDITKKIPCELKNIEY